MDNSKQPPWTNSIWVTTPREDGMELIKVFHSANHMEFWFSHVSVLTSAAETQDSHLKYQNSLGFSWQINELLGYRA